MNNLSNCLQCGKDLTEGVVLLSKSPLLFADENTRYLHCNECGKTYLIETVNIPCKEVDYLTPGIEEDIMQSFNHVLSQIQEEIAETQEKALNSCDCDSQCSTCSCTH